ncbi:arginine--tRNA ligase [Candidatus Pacearchaeota archaeon]|nr:arginine--tRNA ligase [Candidatus Pacearchaeota archaeon]
MKEIVAKELSKVLDLKEADILSLIETPPSKEFGDFAFPCFSFSKVYKKNPIEIAKELSEKITSRLFEKVEANGPYLNFFINRKKLAEKTLKKILKEKEKFGSSQIGKGKKIVIDLSAPNIAKPFGIGHLRSTIIGNSLSEIFKFLGYKTVKINYLGDWGTQFGKLIVGYKKFGNEKSLKKDSIKHLLDVYVKVNQDPNLEEEARQWFKKMEEGNTEALFLWKKFKDLSLEEFDKIYSLLNIKFDAISGESFYNKKMNSVIELMYKKGLIKESEGAEIIDLEKYGLGVCLIKKKDGATLYATRDITAAIDRHDKYKFDEMIYEVGSEQTLHFKQVFKVLELLGFSWAKNCIHINHGLYLAEDGKKFATRKGKTVFMEDILDETIQLAKKEILKRDKIKEKELEERARFIAIAAIFYGDLKNYRSNDLVFNIEKFISFEGDTGPYLLYSYARAKSILSKAKYKNTKLTIENLEEIEKNLILELNNFSEIIIHAQKNFSPNIIANYSFKTAQLFNEFYHSSQVIGSENEGFRLALVASFAQVLKNALTLLGISVIEKM